jgi:glycosyltransferase involved in cell wall biosynthesis
MTPILPRYPVKIIQACQSVPFILGPVNGGVPFPRGFKKIAHKEFAHYNFLRIFTWLLPGYQRTYQQADLILAASEYTLNMLKQRFNLPSSRLELFHENGIFFENFPKNKTEDSETFEIVFVGRLVPYKGADMLLEAIAGMQDHLLQRTHLTIVGDGPEKKILKEQANALGVDQYTTFAGWVAHHDISLYYKRANVFCFPSIREFGGAVALEAMAYGLPCVVPDYAGLSEYVTTDTGFKIEPRSRQFLISEMIEKLQILFQDSQLRQKMSQKARERAQEYQWSQKSMQLLDIYRRICR